MLLEIDSLDSFYGDVQVVRKLALTVDGGEVLCLMGRNGAGKTTLLKSVMGLVNHSGQILFDGNDIGRLPAHQVPRYGIGYVPQGRRLFSELTVRENLRIGLMTRDGAKEDLKEIFSLFPLLSERLDQQSGTLSGGEQQMLAMARALCVRPRLLLLDEPTEGLMPSMIAAIREVISILRDRGVGILLVEQRVEAVLSIADRVAFIENGSIQRTVSGRQIQNESALLQQYVGVSTGRVSRESE